MNTHPWNKERRNLNFPQTDEVFQLESTASLVLQSCFHTFPATAAVALQSQVDLANYIHATRSGVACEEGGAEDKQNSQ
jgi:hypothetical protein